MKERIDEEDTFDEHFIDRSEEVKSQEFMLPEQPSEDFNVNENEEITDNDIKLNFI